jgi:DNA-binding transcriptional regulator LsrR (DeoR family)
MMTSPISRKDLEALKAAYLCAERDLTQAEVGRLLGGLSQSRVSRLLKRADERGWLHRSYRFVTDGLPDDLLAQLKRLVEPSTLVDRLARIESTTRVPVRRVHVLDCGANRDNKRAITARLTRFGRAAAPPLGELLQRSDTFAVTWGGTISHVVEGLKHAPPMLPRANRYVPVCGEPLDQASSQETSSHLAERLHDIVRSTALPPPSLTGVPALIGRRFHGADARGIRRFVEQAGSFREVFGKASPLINKVDSLLTSVGPAQRPMGFVHEELLKAGSTSHTKLTTSALSRLVAGDIGGVLIPRRHLGARDRAQVERLNEMWTGATLAHLERVARQAARSNRPGVILVSIGDDRAEIVAEAVRYGLVNELIIDRHLADALTRRLATTV